MPNPVRDRLSCTWEVIYLPFLGLPAIMLNTTATAAKLQAAGYPPVNGGRRSLPGPTESSYGAVTESISAFMSSRATSLPRAS